MVRFHNGRNNKIMSLKAQWQLDSSKNEWKSNELGRVWWSHYYLHGGRECDPCNLWAYVFLVEPRRIRDRFRHAVFASEASHLCTANHPPMLRAQWVCNTLRLYLCTAYTKPPMRGIYLFIYLFIIIIIHNLFIF